MTTSKMTYGGIGPKLALITLPYVTLSITVMQIAPQFLDLNFLNISWIYRLGIIWIAIGIVFYISSAITFLKHFKKGGLITTGAYSLCRNPIYASIIVFVVPGLGLLFHSGLILSIALVLYINFKTSIHGENVVLQRIFGEEYRMYKKNVNEVIPFPKLRRLVN